MPSPSHVPSADVDVLLLLPLQSALTRLVHALGTAPWTPLSDADLDAAVTSELGPLLSRGDGEEMRAVAELALKTALSRVLAGRVALGLSPALSQRSTVLARLCALLDIALSASSLFPATVAPGIDMALAEDAVDALPGSDSARVFGWVEARSKRLTVGLTPGKGKALALLRLANVILKRASRTMHTVLCGRVMTFLAIVFPLSERSGVNLRGDCHVDNVTLTPSSPMDTDSDSDTQSDATFYAAFWSLQSFFSNPALLMAAPEAPLKLFQDVRYFLFSAHRNSKNQRKSPQRCNQVLDRFEKIIVQDAVTSGAKRRLNAAPPPQPTSHDTHVFFPKFLTAPPLFPLSLASAVFRRQILTQMLILQTFLWQLTSKEKSAQHIINKALIISYTIPQIFEEWLLHLSLRIAKLLDRDSPPSGPQYRKPITHVLAHDITWVKWKWTNCTSFELPRIHFNLPHLQTKILDRSKTFKEKRLDIPSTVVWKPENGPELVLEGFERNRVLRKPLSEYIDWVDDLPPSPSPSSPSLSSPSSPSSPPPPPTTTTTSVLEPPRKKLRPTAPLPADHADAINSEDFPPYTLDLQLFRAVRASGRSNFDRLSKVKVFRNSTNLRGVVGGAKEEDDESDEDDGEDMEVGEGEEGVEVKIKVGGEEKKAEMTNVKQADGLMKEKKGAEDPKTILLETPISPSPATKTPQSLPLPPTTTTTTITTLPPTSFPAPPTTPPPQPLLRRTHTNIEEDEGINLPGTNPSEAFNGPDEGLANEDENSEFLGPII